MAWDEWDDADLRRKSMKEDYSGYICSVVDSKTEAKCEERLTEWNMHAHDGMCPKHYWEFEKKKTSTGEIPRCKIVF